MAWRNGSLVLPLFILIFLAWGCPRASFGQNVRCWWNKSTCDGQKVSIECRADPPNFLQKCGRCQLNLDTSDNTTWAALHECTRNTVNFTSVLLPQAMQDVKCKLSCPDQRPENCQIEEGYPPPTCLIPDFDFEKKDIHCYWGHHQTNLYNVTLHWEVVHRSMYHGDRLWEGDRGRILRTDFVDFNDIRVWVSAESRLGAVESDFADFHTGSIREPLPPSFTNYTTNPLEIFWDVEKEEEHSDEYHCEVRYKKECDVDWTEAKGTYEASFVLCDPKPFTEYTFLVRCGFGTYQEDITMSNWTALIVETPAEAPVGVLDVWTDCEPNSDQPSCNILWKEMPKTQARGKITGYHLRVQLNNGSEIDTAGHTAVQTEQCGMVLDLSVRNGPQDHQSHLTCLLEKDQCRFYYSQLRIPLQEVKDISVTAKSLQGESSPALVALPRTGLPIPEVNLTVKVESQSLIISWSAPQQFTESVQEYVVQTKPIGPPQQMCLHWIKVNKTLNFVELKGEFCNYTVYNVSLFAVVKDRSYVVQSAVMYSVQGVPPKVKDVRVTDISPYSVKLTWKPIPLDKSRGHVLKYLVGIDNQSVWDVNRDKYSTHVPDLDPGKQYEVWISGVTVAGEGERTTTRFTTTTTDNSVKVIAIILLFCLIIIMLVVSIFWLCTRQQGILRFLKVPDPINSKLFQQMNNQFRQSWLTPQNTQENILTISQVEVVGAPGSLLDSEEDHELAEGLTEAEPRRTRSEEDRQREEHNDKQQQEPERLERIDSSHLPKTNSYSQMIDSSEEEASREDEDEEWEEQVSPSDYEKHFLPCMEDL